MEGREDEEEKTKKELRCVMYIYQTPTMKIVIVYHRHVLIVFKCYIPIKSYTFKFSDLSVEL